jgi:hypothetical protein
MNKSMLAQGIDKIKYNDQDNIKIIEGRIKRCIKQATRGRLKKADSALNPGIIANLNINNNWNKTKAKFPNHPIKKHTYDNTISG